MNNHEQPVEQQSQKGRTLRAKVVDSEDESDDCIEELKKAESKRSRRGERRRRNVDESSTTPMRVVWQSPEVEEETAITDREIDGFVCERLLRKGEISVDDDLMPELADESDSEDDSDSGVMMMTCRLLCSRLR